MGSSRSGEDAGSKDGSGAGEDSKASILPPDRIEMVPIVSESNENDRMHDAGGNMNGEIGSRKRKKLGRVHPTLSSQVE